MMSRQKYSKKYLIFGMVMLFALSLFGCSGDDGDTGPQGPQGPPGESSKGTLSGTIMNEASGTGLSGVTVATEPDVDADISTDSSGAYSASLPVGTYTLTFSKKNFESVTESVGIVAGETAAVDISLNPTANVVVNAGADQTGSPGQSLTFNASVEILDGSTDTPVYEWKQTYGAAAVIAGAETASPTITLANGAAYKDALFSHLESLERVMVQPVNPFSLEEAEKTEFEVAVTVGGAVYKDTVAVMAELPYAVNGGIKTVPTGEPVLLHGKTQESYNWEAVSPTGTSVAMTDAATQNPLFTPDSAGRYTITETVSGASLEVYAGTWMGVITGQDSNNRPVTDASCLNCHNDNDAPNQFTPWAQSGHAEIFAVNLNTSTHYGESCFSCHTVGFNTGASANGFGTQADYQGFIDAGLLNKPGDNWTTMLADYPDSAKRGNIQCENCHGPQQNQGAHNAEGKPRTSVASDVCGSCHGEPPRHARFQQWEESGHGNFELAIEEGTRASCAPCHTGNGFVQWAALGFDKDASIESIAEDDIQPITCAACHDPHKQGTTSSKPNTATVRLENTTPELRGGFIAANVGRGAVCMVCHNSRRGPMSTSLYGADYNNNNFGQLSLSRTTHGGPQSDVLMGENGYFVTPGARGPHSYIQDTCTNCHMELTPPPAALSYSLGGTNHKFNASKDICKQCHGVFDGGTLQDSVKSLLNDVNQLIVTAAENDLKAIAGTADVTGVLLNYSNSDNTFDAMLNASGADANTIASVAAEDLNPYGFAITLKDGTVVETSHPNIRIWKDSNGNGAVDSDEITSADKTAMGQIIAKAKWNCDLVESDGSYGIHNPGFVLDILNESVRMLR